MPAGELYLVTSMDCDLPGELPDDALGHAFIVYKNTSDLVVPVGDMDVQPGDQITIGVTGSESVTSEVWYNLESYYYYSNNDFHANVYIKTDVTYGDMIAVGTVIYGWSIYSPVNNNCVHFAVDVWNAVSYIPFSGFLPSQLMNTLMNNYSFNTNLVLSSETTVGYYHPTTGSFVDVY